MSSEAESGPRRPFDHFLAWFDYDRARAADALTEFRPRLLRYFFGKGRYSDAEDLADNVFVRAAEKFVCVVELVKTEPAPFLFTVARLICCERAKERKVDQLANGFEALDEQPSIEKMLADAQILRKIREMIAPAEFDFLIRYYNSDPSEKAQLAKEMGCTPGALRVRKRGLIKKVIRAAHGQAALSGALSNQPPAATAPAGRVRPSAGRADA